MSLGLSIVAAVISYIVLLIISINLVGIVVDGLVPSDPKYQEVEENISEPKSITVTILFCFIIIVYLFVLYNFLNIGTVISALMLIISRIPVSVIESRTGHKINLRTRPTRSIDLLCIILGWMALPVVWYSLFFLQTRLPF